MVPVVEDEPGQVERAVRQRLQQRLGWRAVGDESHARERILLDARQQRLHARTDALEALIAAVFGQRFLDLDRRLGVFGDQARRLLSAIQRRDEQLLQAALRQIQAGRARLLAPSLGERWAGNAVVGQAGVRLRVSVANEIKLFQHCVASRAVYSRQVTADSLRRLPTCS